MKQKKYIIYGERIYLRRLTEEDVTQNYVNWLNNPEINKYLECRFTHHTIEETKTFVKSVTNECNYQFGIFLNDTNEHIGNIKIGCINFIHKFADIGYIIGERKYWGKGYATEAIRLATNFAFDVLKLHKLWGGTYSCNMGSLRAVEKNGYQQEGIKRNQYLTNEGEYVDDILFGKVNEKY